MHSFICDCVSSIQYKFTNLADDLCVVPASRLVAASPYLTCTCRKMPLFCKMYIYSIWIEISLYPLRFIRSCYLCLLDDYWVLDLCANANGFWTFVDFLCVIEI